MMVVGCAQWAPTKPSETAKLKKRNPLHEDLILKEKEVWDAYKFKDAKALGQLMAEDYYAIEDADGEIMSRAEAIRSVSGLELKDYEMKDFAVVEINDGSAIVRYKVKVKGAAYNHAFAPRWSIASSIWVQRAGRWQNLMYQETKIGE